jgi:hypothetical protein
MDKLARQIAIVADNGVNPAPVVQHLDDLLAACHRVANQVCSVYGGPPLPHSTAKHWGMRPPGTSTAQVDLTRPPGTKAGPLQKDPGPPGPGLLQSITTITGGGGPVHWPRPHGYSTLSDVVTSKIDFSEPISRATQWQIFPGGHRAELPRHLSVWVLTFRARHVRARCHRNKANLHALIFKLAILR